MKELERLGKGSWYARLKGQWWMDSGSVAEKEVASYVLGESMLLQR